MNAINESLLYGDNSYLNEVGHPYGLPNAVRYKGEGLAADGFEDRFLLDQSTLLTIKQTNLGRWCQPRFVRPNRLVFHLHLEGQRQVHVAGIGEISIMAPALVAFYQSSSVSDVFAWPEGGSYTSVGISYNLDQPPQCLSPVSDVLAEKVEKLSSENRYLWSVEPMTTEMKSAARDIISPRIHSGLVENFIALKVQELLFLMTDRILAEHSGQNTDAGRADVAQRAKILIDQQNGTVIPVSRLCAELSISESHLTKKFRERFDVTINEYIIRRRLSKAHDLLTFSDLHLKQIAFEAGYKHLSNFCIAFKKRYGITPSECRTESLSNF